MSSAKFETTDDGISPRSRSGIPAAAAKASSCPGRYGSTSRLASQASGCPVRDSTIRLLRCNPLVRGLRIR